jgi:hypothetical protein
MDRIPATVTVLVYDEGACGTLGPTFPWKILL